MEELDIVLAVGFGAWALPLKLERRETGTLGVLEAGRSSFCEKERAPGRALLIERAQGRERLLDVEILCIL